MFRLVPIALLLILALLPPSATASTVPQCGFGLPDQDGLQQPEIAPASFTISNNATDVGWSVSSQGGPDAADDAVGHEDAARLWYASMDPSQANYASGPTGETATHGTATSPAIQIPSAASSPRFFVSSRYEVESGDAATHDLMLIELSTDGGAWTTLCSMSPATAKHGTMDETTCSDGTSPNGAYPCPTDPASLAALAKWEGRSVGLSASVLGHAIKVRFNFDSVDGQQNTGLGWMLTDARVTYTMPPQNVSPPPTPGVSPPSVTIPTIPTSPTPPPPSGVPTLNEYGMMAIVGALAITGTVLVRRGGK